MGKHKRRVSSIRNVFNYHYGNHYHYSIMKAPNKIYIHRKDLSYSEVKESDSDITFIRKDSLLEWAKTKLSHIQEDFDVYTGQRLILRELIEKINAI